MLICTMWDDGLVTDLRLMEELVSRGITATFSLSPGRYGAVRQPNDVRGDYGTLVTAAELTAYRQFDTCVHGWDHQLLTQRDLNVVEAEIVRARNVLSEVMQRQVAGFCYPYGQTEPNLTLRVAKHFAAARSLPPQSRLLMPMPHWKGMHNIWPTAHWAVPNLVPWLIANKPEAAIIWGHTYEFEQSHRGWAGVLALYDELMPHAKFTTFLEVARVLGNASIRDSRREYVAARTVHAGQHGSADSAPGDQRTGN